jgi:hypothetical protein
MRIKLTILVVLYFSLLTTAGSAQTAAEQMQRAIYTQETTGEGAGEPAQLRQRCCRILSFSRVRV